MTTVKLRGEGGGEWDFDLPLSEAFADQVRDGKLVPVDDASAKALAAAGNEPAADAGSDDGKPSNKPLSKMKLAELLDKAEELGVDAETLAELRKPGASKAKVIAAINAATA